MLYDIWKLISMHSACKLISFSFVLFHVACSEKKDAGSTDVSIVWKDGRAIAFSIQKKILLTVPKDSLPSHFFVRLAKADNQPAIAGEYNIEQDKIIFQPFIPFTRGLQYEVVVKQQSPITIEIPTSTEVPKLLAIYPSKDTLPENLLKLYLVFSRPMLKGHSLQYIKLLDSKGDSLPNIFLNLQQELWNEEGTALTLWFDPGRIKRHLQPNQLLGPPLLKGEQYKLVISSQWPDEQGTSLPTVYTKNIFATNRDSSKPDPLDWKLTIPKAGSLEAVELHMQEPHDYFLLRNSIYIINPQGNKVAGTIDISNSERTYSFKPEKPWSAGIYKMQVEPGLEDLAGNNLTRLFDSDLATSQKNNRDDKNYERELKILK